MKRNAICATNMDAASNALRVLNGFGDDSGHAAIVERIARFATPTVSSAVGVLHADGKTAVMPGLAARSTMSFRSRLRLGSDG